MDIPGRGGLAKTAKSRIMQRMGEAAKTQSSGSMAVPAASTDKKGKPTSIRVTVHIEKRHMDGKEKVVASVSDDLHYFSNMKEPPKTEFTSAEDLKSHLSGLIDGAIKGLE